MSNVTVENDTGIVSNVTGRMAFSEALTYNTWQLQRNIMFEVGSWKEHGIKDRSRDRSLGEIFF